MNKKTVLIVEDEPFLSSILKSKLTKEGFNVLMGENGIEALEKVKLQAVDIVLLDLMMPKMNGFDVLKEMQSDDNLKDIPVIILSNLGQSSDVQRGKDLGAVDYIIKSDISINEVLRKVKSHISEEKK